MNAGGNLMVNALVNAGGNGNVQMSAGNSVMQNANVSSNGGSIAATATSGNVIMSSNATSSSYGGTITYFAPQGSMILAHLDAGATGGIELDAHGSIGPAAGLIGPMLTGAAASIEAGGDVIITEAVTRLSIDTPGRITVTDTSTNTTFFVLSDVEQAAAATSNDTSTQELLSATADAVALVGDGSLGIGGQSAAAAASNLATTGGTAGTFGDEEKKKDDKSGDGKDSGDSSGSGTNAALKSVKTCT